MVAVTRKRGFARQNFWPLLAVLALATTFAALPRLGWSLSTDEPWSLLLVRQNLAGMMDWFTRDSSQPVYYLLLRGWYLLVGEDDFLLRLPSLAFYLAALALTGWLGRKWFGSRAGLLAAALLAGSHLLGTVKAASLRPYTLVTFETAAALALFLYLWDQKPHQRWRGLAWMALIGLYLLALLTHTVFAFFVIALTLAALWRGWRFFIAHGLAAASGVILFAAVYLPNLLTTLGIPSRSWMAAPTLLDLGLAFIRLWGLNWLVLLALTAWVFWQRRAVPATRVTTLSADRRLAALLTLVLAAALAPFFVSQFYPVFEESRTPMIILAPASLLAAAALARLSSPQTLGGAVLVFTLLAWVIGAAGFFLPERTPTRASLRAILRHAQCGDVFLSAGLAYNGVEVYRARSTELAACTTHLVFPAEMVQHPGWVDRDGMLAAQQMALTAEAEQLAAALNQQSPGRVWVFARDDPFDRLLLTALEQSLHPASTLTLTGNYFDAVRVYSPRP